MINDNYFGRSTTMRWPVGGRRDVRVKLPVFPGRTGCNRRAGAAIAREADGREDVAAAAAAAGMGERTAHRWQRGALPSAAKAPRTWRTREDPFADVWLSEVVPRLVADAAGRLQALTLFEWLCQQHPGRFRPGQLRTLQRRVRTWRRSTVRITRCISSRWRCRAGKRRSTSRTRATWE